MPKLTGNGTTITFGTTGFTAEWIELGGPTHTRGDMETSHLETEDYKTYQPEDLAEPGELSGRCYFTPGLGEDELILEDPEPVTITYAGGGTLSGTAYCKSFKAGDLKNNELSVAEVGLKFDGLTGPAYTGA